MYVERYYQEENVNLVHDQDSIDKWNQLANELGVKNPEAGSLNPMPFKHANKSIINIIKTLCPSQCEFKDFKAGTIPLEVLELIALCVREKYFNKIQIHWDEESPDPFVTGLVGYYVYPNWHNDIPKEIADKQFSSLEEAKNEFKKYKNIDKDPNFYDKQSFLIARWGDEKRSLDELRDLAYKKYISVMKAENENKIRDLQNEMEKAENAARLKFGVI